MSHPFSEFLAGIPTGGSGELLTSSGDSPQPRGWLTQLRCPYSVWNSDVHAERRKAKGS